MVSRSNRPTAIQFGVTTAVALSLSVERVDLQQDPSGELFGFGKIITNVHSSQFKRETDVIISGLAKDEGLAKIKLSPLFKGGDGPVTMVAQINGASDNTSYPAILFVISVKGKLLGPWQTAVQINVRRWTLCRLRGRRSAKTRLVVH